MIEGPCCGTEWKGFRHVNEGDSLLEHQEANTVYFAPPFRVVLILLFLFYYESVELSTV